jgi:Gram-negative bacterial tonB protein.
VVPDLLSGTFDRVLGSTFTRQLQGYSGPPSRHLLPADLLEREELKFETYVPVAIPPIALAARVLGDVRLRLTLDRTTGAVTVVERVSGNTLLSEPAAAAARLWRFTPASLTDDPLEITLRFQPRCGG